MSELDIDAMPRMKDYLKPEDLNTNACVNLAATVLSEQANELAHAARRYANFPTKENGAHLKKLREWYETPMFDALSCGMVDGKTAAKNIIRDALRGVKVEA